MPNAQIPTPRGLMPSYLAVPSSATAPAVVVIHDIFGMSQDHRKQADWLAEAGFLALSIDLYHQGGMVRCVRSVMRQIAARSGSAFDDVEAARSWLLSQPNCNGKAGVVGFCMGGGFALLLASRHGFSASSVNYGGPLPKDVDDFLQTACPVVGSYGGKSKWEKGVAEQLEQALDRARVPHDVKEYPDAGHGFMNNHGSFVLMLMRFTGVGWNEPAAMDARRRITAFFHAHLDSERNQ
jgi:carboxymethylenebutenolidase